MYNMESPNEYTDEDNQAYVAFIKAFAYVPVLLHLASDNNDIIQIIHDFQKLSEDAIPDKTKTERLRGWVDSKMDEIGNMSQEEIDRIIENAKLNRLDIKEYHTGEYTLHGKRKPTENCLITMDRIKRDEYYVDFLDKGKPYKVGAIVEYYKRLKIENKELEKKGIEMEWKTPLRNIMTAEDREKLDDLVKWYENTTRCTRSTRKQKRSLSKSLSKTRKSPSKTRKYRKTRRNL